MEQNNQLGLPVIDSASGYNPEKTYTVYVNPTNRHIAGLIGFVVGIDHIDDGNGFLYFNIPDLTEDEYNEISRSINSTEAMTFLDQDNRTIISRRIYIDMLENTFFDSKLNMMYGVDNKINLNVRCVDKTLNGVEDVTEIELKNIKKSDQPISMNGQSADEIKLKIPNPSKVTLELLGTVGSPHTVRVKVKVPQIDYLWLTAYPQMMKISDESNQELKQWLANNS
jgi:hypothetical protein